MASVKSRATKPSPGTSRKPSAELIEGDPARSLALRLPLLLGYCRVAVHLTASRLGRRVGVRRHADRFRRLWTIGRTPRVPDSKKGLLALDAADKDEAAKPTWICCRCTESDLCGAAEYAAPGRGAPPVSPRSQPARGRLRRPWFLPRGRRLSDEVWDQRHRGLTILLWLHIPALFAFVALRGLGLVPAAFECGALVAAALVAGVRRLSRNMRSASTSIGLVIAASFLVHLGRRLDRGALPVLRHPGVSSRCIRPGCRY